MTTAADDEHIGLNCCRCTKVTSQAPSTHRPFCHIILTMTKARSGDGCVCDGAPGSFSSWSALRCDARELQLPRRPPRTPRSSSTAAPLWIRAQCVGDG